MSSSDGAGGRRSDRLDPLVALDLAQTGAAWLIAHLTDDHWARPTPCDEWSVRDVVNKMTASTLMFAAFGRRERLDPPYDLVHPPELIGDDPLAVFQSAAEACRVAWRSPGALDGEAPSTVGQFPAKAVLNARIFDTTILSWDVATATANPHGIGDPLARYVGYVAERLVGNVRRVSPERYKDAVSVGADADPVTAMIATTGRDPTWKPPLRES